MPEGHTLHRLAQDMAELVGETVTASSPQGRFAADEVSGRRVAAVEAYGKHLLVDLEEAPSVHVHLGMRGKWLRFSPVTGPGLKQVRLRLATGEVAWDLIAPSACDLFDDAQRADLLARLGPDPLRPEADAAVARARWGAYRGSIGAALMDQGTVAGVGNVFRAEALHAVGIAPQRPADQVSGTELDRLWEELGTMMAQAVVDGRIITVAAEDRQAVPEEESRRVYKRARCVDCGTPVRTATLAGRTAYWCPQDQPR